MHGEVMAGEQAPEALEPAQHRVAVVALAAERMVAREHVVHVGREAGDDRVPLAAADRLKTRAVRRRSDTWYT